MIDLPLNEVTTTDFLMRKENMYSFIEPINIRQFQMVTEKELEKKYNKNELTNCVFKYPQRADNGSAGYDFFSPIDTIIYPKTKLLIWTGFKIRLPEDNVLLLDTRSGNGTKKDIILANTIGVIDSSYYNNPSNEGHIGICLKNDGIEPFYISKNDAIAQGIITQYLITTDDNPTKKDRTGGFGSTSKIS